MLAPGLAEPRPPARREASPARWLEEQAGPIQTPAFRLPSSMASWLVRQVQPVWSRPGRDRAWPLIHLMYSWLAVTQRTGAGGETDVVPRRGSTARVMFLYPSRLTGEDSPVHDSRAAGRQSLLAQALQPGISATGDRSRKVPGLVLASLWSP